MNASRSPMTRRIDDADSEILRLRKALQEVVDRLKEPPDVHGYATAAGRAQAIAELALEIENRWSRRREPK